LPWDRPFVSTHWSYSLCSGCTSCFTTPGQAIGLHNVSVHPSQPHHPTSAPESPNPLLVSPISPTARPVNRYCALSPITQCPATAPHPHPGTAPSGRHLTAFLSRSRLCLSWLARVGQYQCQRSSKRRSLATAAVQPLWGILSGDSWHHLSWQECDAQSARVGGKCVGGRLGIRAVARVFGVDPNTVLQRLVEAADHLKAFSQYILHDVRVTQVQLDELFALLIPYRYEHTAFTASTK
jgi:hypothetical protein